MSYNSHISQKTIVNLPEGDVYPVYILSRIVQELIQFCKSTIPKEALGFLVGNRAIVKNNEGISFTRITDWVTGSIDSTHISANFTTEGLQQANLFLDDRYGMHREQNHELPSIVGIVHSHPFFSEPFFSDTDLDTFLSFPYDTEGNVFILIDPEIPYFKVFKIIEQENQKILQMVPWIEYSPIQSDLRIYNNLEMNTLTIQKDHQKNITPDEGEKVSTSVSSDLVKDSTTKTFDENVEQTDIDDEFTPPKIERLGSAKSKKTDKRKIFD